MEAEKREVGFGYVDRHLRGAGSYSAPKSFREAVQEATRAGVRLVTNPEYQRLLTETAEQVRRSIREVYDEDGDLEIKVDREAQGFLENLYGNHFGSPGYAGARTMTGTVANRDGRIREIDSMWGDYPFGRENYYRWFGQAISQAQKLQSQGQTPYIHDFDEETGLPTAVSDKPNKKYHGAIFWFSPQVKEWGVVVRGIHHSVGERCAEYDVAVLPTDYKDIMLGHRLVSKEPNAASVGLGALLVGEMAENVRRGKIPRGRALEKIASEIENAPEYAGMTRRQFNSRLATAAGLLGFYLAFGAQEAEALKVTGTIRGRIDGNPMSQGIVRLKGNGMKYKSSICSDVTFTMRRVRRGTYDLIIKDKAGQTVYVDHLTKSLAVNTKPFTLEWTVIERGNNRLVVPFDANFQEFYGEMAQR